MKQFPRGLQFKSLSALVIAVAAFVSYQPGFKIGFLDGWWYLEWASTLDLPSYIAQFFDPGNVTQGYRPIQGMYVLVEYAVSHFNPDGYHLAHTLLHAANGILLFAIVGRLSKNWRLGLLAALFYVASPVFALAVFWYAVVDPLSTLFYLLTVWLWTYYLDTRHPVYIVATWVAYVFALLSKETSVSLAFLLFLIDWAFYSVRLESCTIVRQYAPFILILLPYLLLVINVQSHGEFTSQWGFQIGPHMAANLLPYLAVLTFPAFTEKPTALGVYLWMAVATLVYVLMMLRMRSKPLFLLAILALTTVAPLLGFPQQYYNTRYLYMPMMSTSVLMGIIVESGWRAFRRSNANPLIPAALVVMILLPSSEQVSNLAAGLGEYTRQLGEPLRQISWQHPTFPEPSLLYFVYSPKTPLGDLKGLSMVTYGSKVMVSGTEDTTLPDLQSHPNAFVYYFDNEGHTHEIRVAHYVPLHSSVRLPAAFDVPIRLETIQVINPIVHPGDPLILILSWRAQTTLTQDYSVVVHLLDASNHVVGQSESGPRRGTMPTSLFETGDRVIDAVLLPLDKGAMGNNYRIELELADPATLHAHAILDEYGQTITDRVTITPIGIQ